MGGAGQSTVISGLPTTGTLVTVAGDQFGTEISVLKTKVAGGLVPKPLSASTANRYSESGDSAQMVNGVLVGLSNIIFLFLSLPFAGFSSDCAITKTRYFSNSPLISSGGDTVTSMHSDVKFLIFSIFGGFFGASPSVRNVVSGPNSLFPAEFSARTANA